MQLGVIIGLLFGFVIAFFAVLNTAPVTVNYYLGQVNASVALVIFASAAMGALAVGFVGLLTQVRTGFALWDYRNKLQRLTKEVEELKEQKRALSDDLAFINAECEIALQQKEAQLDDCRNEVQETDADEWQQEPEEKKDNDE